MKNPLRNFLVSSRAITALALACGLVQLALLTGCITTQEVSKIVAQSNAALLGGRVGLPEPGPGAKSEPWRETAGQIEAFVAAHPDQPAVTAPLRVREAMLLLANGQYNQAREVFALVGEADLVTDRDKALRDNADTLVWWFANSTKSDWDDRDRRSAQEGLAALAAAQDRLRNSPEIRDYLAELRAWIGVAAAKQSTNEGKARDLVVDALDRYAAIFTPADLAALAAGNEKLPDLSALSQDLKRRLRAKAVLEFAREVNRTNRLGAHPSTPFFDQFINR